ncbi:MAG: acyl carrier protein [Paludibacteraceae bacterium]|nr:acyl carrier protein [Paludibacteraceae bacterium]
MTRNEIEQKVNQFFVETLEYDANSVKPEASLREDLGMTSLDAVETAIFIKRTFGFQPERGDMFTLHTLADVYTYIEQHQQ